MEDKNEYSKDVKKRLTQDEKVKGSKQMDTLSLMVSSSKNVTSFIGLGLIVGLVAFLFSQGTLGILIAGLVSIFLTLVLTLSPVLWAYIVSTVGNIEFAVTNERFMKVENRIINEKEVSVPLERVRDIELSQDTLDKILGTGDISIERFRKGDTASFDNIPDAEDLYQIGQETIQETSTVDDFAADSRNKPKK